MLNNKKLMPPPWLAYPEIERYSIGWRMGYGEDYIGRFFGWLDSLSQEEQTEYQDLFPEPITWMGWWEDDDTSKGLEQEEFFVQFWQPSGIPQYTRSKIQEDADNRHGDFCLFWKPQPTKDGSIAKSCFSQWWIGEFRSVERIYCCMEQFMMEQKAELFGDKEIQHRIMESHDPKEMKALGRKVQRFDQELWDRVKYSIVLNGNWCKFSQNKELGDFLLSTGDSILAEASPYDAIWGIRLSASSPDAQDPSRWRGQNLLGFALMEVRDELRRIRRNESLCDWSLVR